MHIVWGDTDIYLPVSGAESSCAQCSSLRIVGLGGLVNPLSCLLNEYIAQDEFVSVRAGQLVFPAAQGGVGERRIC